MLGYRHSFHAGNPADVLKHAVLIYCLEYCLKKEKPVLCVDTHAGAGVYTIKKNLSREWENGVGKLPAYAGTSTAVPASVSGYLKRLTDAMIYNGSPLLMAKLLRMQDRLVCFELHPKDFAELNENIKSFRAAAGESVDHAKIPKIEVRQEDGPLMLKSLLPPPSGRGLIFIDPAWEEKDEYEIVPLHTAAALKRFPQGLYVIWYPLLKKPKTVLSNSIGKTLLELYEGNRCRLELFNPAAEISENSPRGMHGSGLVIYNPPWTLKQELGDLLPFLAEVLMNGGEWNLEWKE